MPTRFTRRRLRGTLRARLSPLASRPILSRRCTLLALVVLTNLPSSVFPQSYPTFPTWITDGPVHAIATTSDTVYLGGDFRYLRPYPGAGVPVDRDSGQPTRFDYPRILSGVIYKALPDGAGGFFIGGTFDLADHFHRNGLAHILPDGSIDPDWHPDPNGAVHDMLLLDGTIYLGGSFYTIDGQPRPNVAAIDAATGELLPFSADLNGLVATLAFDDGTLFVGGRFSAVGEQPRSRLASFDLASGSLTTWNPGADDRVECLAAADGRVFATGLFDLIGGQPREYLAALDADSGALLEWNPQPDGPVSTVVASGTQVYLGGSFTRVSNRVRWGIAELDAATAEPTSWNPGSSSSNSVRAITLYDGLVYVAGGFSQIGGQSRDGAAALDAVTGAPNAWNPNPQGTVYSLAVTSSTILIGGSLNRLGDPVRRDFIAALDASTGAPTDWDPGASHRVSALAISGNTLYVGGDFILFGGRSRNRIAAIELDSDIATDWNPGADDSVLAIAAAQDAVYIGGVFTQSGARPRAHFAALDPTTNTALAWNPDPDDRIRALMLIDHSLYAAGNFTTIAGQPRGGLAALDTASGAALPWIPFSSYAVTALARWNETLYTQFHYRDDEGSGRSAIAAIDTLSGAEQWRTLLPGTVFALAATPNTLYAGGTFETLGEPARRRLAAFDRATGYLKPWHPRPNDDVRALSASGSTVYAGGDFFTQGEFAYREIRQTYLTQYDESSPPVLPSNPAAVDIQPRRITWTWRDNASGEDGFVIWADAGADPPATFRASTEPDMTSWTFEGLSPNTLYSFQVAADNITGASARTDLLSTWTLATTPRTPIPSGGTTSTLDLTLGPPDGNSTPTEYALYFDDYDQWISPAGNLTPEPAWATRDAWTTLTLTGLDPATLYLFHARARNALGVQTPNSAVGWGGTDVTLHYLAGPGGSIAGPARQIVDYVGTTAPVTAVPNPNYAFLEWSDRLRTPTRTDTNVTDNKTHTARFILTNPAAHWTLYK